MAISMARQMMAMMPELRFQPTEKRVRARLGDVVIADTTRAVLVWEPMRVVPSYAVPEADIRATLRPAVAGPVPQYRPVGLGADSPAVLDPRVPFAVHTASGEPLTLDGVENAGFRLLDPDLSGYVILDFAAFEWQEEDETIVSHPRDPYHRIDVRRSSRRIRIEDQGSLLAETDRARLLFEAAIPLVRYYVPREDVRAELRPATMDTTCAYKGHATHYTAVVGDRELPNIAWSYEEPLNDAIDVREMVAFYQERLDVTVDGERAERARTPWS